jgi:hypothetical protein
LLRRFAMASHSCVVTVDVAPADSAVSVVGTGVELGARPDAMFAIKPSMVLCCGILLAPAAVVVVAS